MSEVTSELLSSGAATFSQIAQLFETDAKTLPQRMRGIAPVGSRNGYKIYNIREAASRLVKPGYEIEDFIRQMSPQELPPLLSKEYWNGQRARVAFEREQGNLWPTEDVVEAIAVLQQGIRQSLILAVDDVDRDEGFTDGQRKAFRRIVDTAITKLGEDITEKFKEYYDNRPEPLPMGRANHNSRAVLDTPEDEEVDI